ncbi:MAG: family 10 glycosylhydrolase [Candidatus Magasanikbacteria bacterium]|nr:family 10 glycosylhydrolase [Candidatus Magasanikbacteria bacterium]
MMKYVFGVLLCSIFLVSGCGVVEIESTSEEHVTSTDNIIEEVTRQKPEKKEAKGIYLTAYSAGSVNKVDKMIDLIKKTELNTIVIDIKDYSGLILYDSDIKEVNELQVEDNRLGDVPALIEKLHKEDIYVIARQTVFQDPALASKKPEWAITHVNGGLWHDYNNLTWVDPTRKEVWEYNVKIAKEAIALGFDEINFDYVRYPSDGLTRLAVYHDNVTHKNDTMRDFFEYISKELEEEPAWISVDLFGFVMERFDGINIGQRLVDVVDTIDYVSPMMYPSHYPVGHLGFQNPALYPAAVIENGMKSGAPYFEGKKAEARPWIQAFHIGARYDGEKIRAQIDNVEKYTDGGWLLWNAANNYSTAGLTLTEES